MRKIIQATIILLGISIPSKIFAFGWFIFLMYIRQDIEKPEVMTSWKGFFLPQIKVESSYLTYNECEYIFPTRVKAFRSCCDSNNDIKTEYIKSDSNKQVVGCTDKKGNIVAGVGTCICAKRVLANCKTDAGFGRALLGCYKLPLGPPPPPFCDNFKSLPQIKIVPVKNNNFFNPKIKVMVGTGNNKQCDNTDIISLNASCTDGSLGTLYNYKSMILGVRADGTSKGYQTLSYNGTGYIFEAKQDKDRICGLYYGDDNSTKNVISSACYDLPTISKPVIVNPPSRIDNLLNLNSSIFIEATVKDYNNDKPFKLQYSTINGGVLHKDTKLKLIRPEIDKEHLFKYNALCYNSSGATKLGTINDDGIVCPTNYKDKVKLRYKENSNGTVLCISEQEKGIDEYMVMREGNKIFKMKELGKAFIPHSYNSITANWDIDYRKNPSNLLISNSTQDLLDKVQLVGAGIFTIYPDNYPSYNAKYKKLEIISNAYSIPEKIRNKMNLTTLSADEGMKRGLGISNNAYYVVKTNFIDAINNTSFFLTKEEEEKAQYLPLNPYLRELCIHNFPTVDYTDTTQDNFFTPTSSHHSCDFVSIEAWGGGASGYIFSDSTDPLISQHGKSFSGAAGGYTKAMIKIDKNSSKNVLKMQIGKGGNQSTQTGGSTIIYLCDSSKNNCSILLKAHGGKAFRTAANELDLKGSSFDQTKVIFIENYPGQEGEYETSSKPYPDVPEPMMKPDGSQGQYVEWKNTNCYDSSKIDINNKAQASDVPGMGGCVHRDTNVWQPGAKGRIRLMCEKWSK